MKSVPFSKIKNKRIFEQVIEQVNDLVRSEKFNPGDQLPPERQISEMMGVHRHSVREALKILEYMGVIETKAGSGTVISNLRKDILVERIKKASIFSPQAFLLELVELRLILEPQLAALAAERATDVDLEAMKEAVEALERENETAGAMTDADEKLHSAIARATHNETISRVIGPVMEMLWEFRERLANTPLRRKKAIEEHKRIYEAIRRRSVKAAQARMKEHLARVREALNQIHDDEKPTIKSERRVKYA
jgi:GntR family transcriptional repressor for pyruvate dehydrogenase complex